MESHWQTVGTTGGPTSPVPAASYRSRGGTGKPRESRSILALLTMVAADSARATVAFSSASVKSPSAFSANKVAHTRPPITTGTPKKLRISGCPGGNP